MTRRAQTFAMVSCAQCMFDWDIAADDVCRMIAGLGSGADRNAEVSVADAFDRWRRDPQGSSGGRCFLNEFFRTIFSSRMVRKSQPRTSMWLPFCRVPVNLHSDTP